MENNFFESPLFQEALKIVEFRMDEASKRQVNIFGQTWYEKHFKVAEYAKTRDEFSTLLGQLHLTIAASTLNKDAEAPVRPLDGFGTVKQEMLRFGNIYQMKGEDIRAIAEYQRLYNRTADRQMVVNYIVEKLFDLRKKAVDGVKERLDILILSMLSNDGKFTFTAENDPNSPFIGQTIEFGFDAGHVLAADTAWTAANKATVDVIGDISDVVMAAEVTPTKMLMDKETLNYILGTTLLKRYINGTDAATRPITATQVNEELERLGLPTIELVQKKSRTFDGSEFHVFTPWKKGKILFIPEDKLGTIEHLVSDHDMGIVDPGVSYSKYDNIEITSWTTGQREGTRHTEHVKASLVGTPVWDSALNCLSLDTKLG